MLFIIQERRAQQVKIEIGEPVSVPSATPASKTQVDLQQRILSILNDKKVATKTEVPVIQTTPAAGSQNKLLNDPTVRKALDSILQKLA